MERNAKRKDPKTKQYVDNHKSKAFDNIFGEGRAPPPNLALANRVLLKFNSDFPSLSVAGQKTHRSVAAWT